MSETTNRSSMILFSVIDADDTDFENFRLGMWKQSKEDVLDWYFKKGFTQTAKTGPDRDHTSGSGGNHCYR